MVLRPSLTPKRKQGRDLLLTHITFEASLLFHPEGGQLHFPLFPDGKTETEKIARVKLPDGTEEQGGGGGMSVHPSNKPAN